VPGSGGGRRILVTGGLGFIGSNLVRLILAERAEVEVVVNLDNMSYAGSGQNLADIERDARLADRYRFVRGDICDGALVRDVLARERVDAILHLAAESHVDRSILQAAPFIQTNVEGTRVLLEAARAAGDAVKAFLHVSTDEVYGSLGETGRFTEETPVAPNSPYSASKAASDLLARAYHHTYGVPVVITRCSNNYGPYQFPEKLIPLMVTNALDGRELPVYGDGRNVRDWIHVEDHCRGLLAALDRGRPGEVYNLGGESERENIAVVRTILGLCGRGVELIRYVRDRPGHDRRYAIDAAKAARDLGFKARWSFDAGLEATVAWYRDHRAWWERLKDPDFKTYYARQYGDVAGASRVPVAPSTPGGAPRG
jgi:dTDP-glucose 4,6-dehydratase